MQCVNDVNNPFNCVTVLHLNTFIFTPEALVTGSESEGQEI